MVTNYHVVGSYVEEPARNRIRVRSENGPFEARLLRFDLLNDLALLRVDGLSRLLPLPLAEREPASGERIARPRQPRGAGDEPHRGRLQRPRRQGGRGSPPPVHAPELRDERRTHPRRARRGGGDERGRIWLANSLSFGVPTASLRPLLGGPDLALEPAALRAEVNRQLDLVDARTTERAIVPFVRGGDAARVKVGGADWARPSRALRSAGTHTRRGRTRAIGSPSSSATWSSRPRWRERARSAPCSSRCSTTSSTTTIFGGFQPPSRARPRPTMGRGRLLRTTASSPRRTARPTASPPGPSPGTSTRASTARCATPGS